MPEANPQVAPVPPPPSQPRVYWRAVVGAIGTTDSARQGARLAWHLATCATPSEPSAHCPVGQALVAAKADPDGHCLHAGRCVRCDDLAV
jgi:hypothetical protein